MAFVVIYDACVLYPAPLRDLLIRVARTGVVRAQWSNLILDECFRNILANRPDLSPGTLQRTRELMNKAVADSLVTGFEHLVDGLDLPDPDDRHVLAAAVRAGAQAIVTANLKDFPAAKPKAIRRRSHPSRRLPARPARPRAGRDHERRGRASRRTQEPTANDPGPARHAARPRACSFDREAPRVARHRGWVSQTRRLLPHYIRLASAGRPRLSRYVLRP